jgi:hypothetical protein
MTVLGVFQPSAGSRMETKYLHCAQNSNVEARLRNSGVSILGTRSSSLHSDLQNRWFESIEVQGLSRGCPQGGMRHAPYSLCAADRIRLTQQVVAWPTITDGSSPPSNFSGENLFHPSIPALGYRIRKPSEITLNLCGAIPQI